LVLIVSILPCNVDWTDVIDCVNVKLSDASIPLLFVIYCCKFTTSCAYCDDKLLILVFNVLTSSLSNFCKLLILVLIVSILPCNVDWTDDIDCVKV